MTPAFDRWNALKKKAQEGGGADRVAKHRAAGKLSARERLETFFDPESFVEIDPFVTHRVSTFGLDERRIPGDGVVTGWGEVEGRPVCAFAQDATVFGGALGEAHAMKIVKIMETARKAGVPVVGLNDSGGARIQEGVMSLGGTAKSSSGTSRCRASYRRSPSSWARARAGQSTRPRSRTS